MSSPVFANPQAIWLQPFSEDSKDMYKVFSWMLSNDKNKNKLAKLSKNRYLTPNNTL